MHFNDKGCFHKGGRIKLRHQDIRFYVTYRRGEYNPADYLSRHVMSWDISITFKKRNLMT